MTMRALTLCAFLFFQLATLSAQQWQTGLYAGSGLAFTVVEQRSPQSLLLLSIHQYNRPFLHLGILSRRQLSGTLAFRPQAGLLLTDNRVVLVWSDRNPHREDLSSAAIVLSPLFELRNRRLPAHPFVHAGPTLQYHLPVKHAERRELELEPLEAGLAFGVGFDFATRYFRLRPEITFNLGLSNRLRAASEVRYIQEIGGIRQDLIGLRLVLLSL